MLFNHTASELLDLCRRTLDLAKAAGATAAEADFSESLGQSVSVRLGEIEQIEFQQDKSLDITVYVGKRKGRAAPPTSPNKPCATPSAPPPTSPATPPKTVAPDLPTPS